MSGDLTKRANEIREELRVLAAKLCSGDDRQLVVWIIAGALACAVCHLPWDDPAHRPVHELASFAEELLRVRAAALECFDKLPKPILLHCSAGIDRSAPVCAYLDQERGAAQHALYPSGAGEALGAGG